MRPASDDPIRLAADPSAASIFRERHHYEKHQPPLRERGLRRGRRAFLVRGELSGRLQLRLRRGRRHRRERPRPPRHGVVQPRGREPRVHVRRYEALVGQDRELPGRAGHRPRRHGHGHPAAPLPVLVRGHRAGEAGRRHGSRHLHAQGTRPGIPPERRVRQGRHRHIARRHRRGVRPRGRRVPHA